MEELIFNEQKLKAMLVELRSKKSAVLAKTDSLNKKRDAILAKIEPLRQQAEAIGNEIAAVEAIEDLATISRNIAKILRVLKPETVRSLAAESGSFGIQEA